ncbi:hypothetical protein ACO0QE_001832 [Hanseniaspora vineae]
MTTTALMNTSTASLTSSLSTTLEPTAHIVQTVFQTETVTSVLYPTFFSLPLVLTSVINSTIMFWGNLLARTSWKLLGLVILKIPYYLIISSSIRVPIYGLLTIVFIVGKIAYGFIDKKYVHSYTEETKKLLQNSTYGTPTSMSMSSKDAKNNHESQHERDGDADLFDEYRGLTKKSKFNKFFDESLEYNRNINGYSSKDKHHATNTHGTIFNPVNDESYLNRFLRAIQIFGYLESDEFNELTKSMKSERLSEGEILLLNDISGFVVLVEGSVGIYYKLDEKKDEQNGDVVAAEEEDFQNSSHHIVHENAEFDTSGSDSEHEEDDSEDESTMDNMGFQSHCTVDGENFHLLNIVKTGNPVSSLVSILRLFTYDEKTESNLNSDEFSTTSVKLPQLIAKASSNCTIAIIPPESFQNLTKKYPRSASYMIQMILTKLYRVTFQTAHKYLGLTKEIMKTEIALNQNFEKNSLKSKQLHDFLINMIDNTTTNTNSLKGSENLELNSKSSITGVLGARQVLLSHSNKNSTTDLLSNASKNNSHYDLRNHKNSEMSSPFTPLAPIHSQETNDQKWRSSLIEIFFQYLGIDKTNIIPHDSTSSSPIEGSSHSLEAFTPPTPKIIHTNGLSIYKMPSSRTIPKKKKSTVEPTSTYKPEFASSSESVDFDTATYEFSNALELEFIPKGSVLVNENENLDGLLYVISGTVQATCRDVDTGKDHKIYTVTSGNIMGFLSSLVGNSNSLATLKAKTDLYIAFLPSKIIEHLCDKYFMIYLRIAETLIFSLSSNILKLDYALEWIHLGASELLFKKGDQADAIYVVLSGRLREFLNRDVIIKEFVQGESFGEVEVLTASKRLSTVISIRDTDLARIPRTLYEYLSLEHPSTMFKVSRLVAKQILMGKNEPSTQSKFVSENGFKYDFDLLIPPTTRDDESFGGNDRIESSTNYRTISILPLAQGLPVHDFAIKLVNAFKDVGRSVIAVDQRTVLAHLGKHAFDKLAKIKETGYFADLEETYQTVIYIGDSPANSSWISTCVSQADCVLFLGDDQDLVARARLTDYEKVLLRSKYTPRVELILLHQQRYVEPGSTQHWLKIRPFVESHHHVEFNIRRFMPVDSVVNNNPSRTQVLSLSSIKNKFIEKVKKDKRFNTITKKTSKFIPNTLKTLMQQPFRRGDSSTPSVLHTHKNDFLRLARILSNQSIGVVLGGGGARGVSHIGVLKALEDQGIPIDVIGGTSIGAFVGGLYAKEYDIVPIYGRVKKFCSRIGSLWRMLSDLTLPITSYTTGHEFNKGVWQAFGNSRIEDFWLQFYCNSTNITESLHEIHTKGIAWRYIRASMSLVSLVPPMVDTNGSMLCDGGYIENVAVQELKRRGCKTIFAVDVGASDIRTKMDYGDYLSGFWILLNRWNPFSSHADVPSMTEIQLRLGYISSVNALEKAKLTPGVIYARPPVENIGTLAFSEFEETYQIGEKFGQAFFKDLHDNNKLPKLPGSKLSIKGELPKPVLQRRNSI